jgi:radical SAM superfamily enzyme YgiQ (UPF0313 family)
MRLVLVDNFVMPGQVDPSLFDVHPHLGLASLAAVAMQDNHRVAIYDPKREIRFGRGAYNEAFYQRAADDILRLTPDAVGFTTLGCSFLFAVNVAQFVKLREPDLPILLGGPHATMLDRPILDAYAQFDVVVRHEAEESLPPLLAKIETRAFDDIPGITWRSSRDGAIKTTPGLPKIEDLDQLPIPRYDLYPVEDLDLDLMRVEAGRGCPFVCTFCSTASFFHRDYRLKSPDRIVREMDLLHERYGATEFKLDHDLFTVNRRKVRAFCEAVAERDYQWRVSARTDCVDAELLEAMALAGCIGLYFGVETGSKRMQKIVDKRLKLDGVERILDVAENFGIETTVSFITGYPEELIQDQNETLDMLGACFARPHEACTPQLHILVPEPGTPMFHKYGKTLAYDGYATKFNARLFGETDRHHILTHPELYSTYYYYPAAMPRDRYTFAVDAVDVFRAVGHEVLSYALRFFQRQLSVLINLFYEWVEQRGSPAKIEPALVVEFISDKFGTAHHLASLFKFGFAIAICRANKSSRQAPGGNDQFDPEDFYQLNPQSHIFTDLHDCAKLLECIRTLPSDAGPLELDEVGEPRCYVTIVEAERSVHYSVDHGVEDILRLFERPQRLGDVMAFLRHIAGDTLIHDHLLDEMIEIGALIRAAQIEHGKLDVIQ